MLCSAGCASTGCVWIWICIPSRARSLDTHPYFAFDQRPNDAPIATSDDPASAGG
ncbi:hypothetical protein B0H17DRAFT_1056915 [Mycena rosella]|uniref:Uncharacterized protein n=1 Tax=Mycena rosella TaxID=1033263 RepID=A0AAD7GK95_MYCRO|nr:hypothetical protein B0H17DRAFT_1056915 [Mycena rosella]